jgi:hypothetical protein
MDITAKVIEINVEKKMFVVGNARLSGRRWVFSDWNPSEDGADAIAGPVTLQE